MPNIKSKYNKLIYKILVIKVNRIRKQQQQQQQNELYINQSQRGEEKKV